MRALSNILLVILLLGNAIPALISGWQMMADPGGAKIFLDPAMLHGVFHSFLVPGIVLFFAIGIGSVLSLIMLISKNKTYPFSIVMEGLVVCIYVSVEIWAMHTFETIQKVYIAIGALILLCGVVLLSKSRHTPHVHLFSTREALNH